MRVWKLPLMGAAMFIWILAAAPVAAQTNGEKLAGLLADLILRGIETPGGGAGFPHNAHFTPFNRSYIGQRSSALGIPEIAVVANFNRALATELATFPLGSSSGGFTYSFDNATGAYTRASSSFGPAFAERSRTIGRKKLSVGFNYRHSSYDSFEGVDVQDGSIRFYLPHNDCCPGQTAAGTAVGNGTLLSPGFEGDLLQVSLSLKASTDTAALFFNYGVTSQWDIGAAVPIVRVDLDATADAEILRLATGSTDADRLIHTFQTGNPNATRDSFPASGSAAGIGDIILRTKYNFLQSGATGLAAALDLRLPTGDEEELLGTGTTQAKLFLVASSGTDRFGQHFNVGYTFSGKGRLEPLLGSGSQFVADAFRSDQQAMTDEFNYNAGLEVVAHPRLTIVGDIVGRTLRDAGRLEVVPKTFEFVIQGTAAPIRSATFDEFERRTGNLNLVLGTVGVKASIAGNLLVSGHVIGPFTDAGLKDKLTIAFGLDYAF